MLLSVCILFIIFFKFWTFKSLLLFDLIRIKTIADGDIQSKARLLNAPLSILNSLQILIFKIFMFEFSIINVNVDNT